MKTLQTSFLKIMLSSVLLFSLSTGFAQNEKARLADSLFKAKQFTQSLELYQSVFAEKKYSPSMLLKMAYINEGLGKTWATLYFLKLYNLATDDDDALKKAEELAAKYKLAGYEANDASRVKNLLSRNLGLIQGVLALAMLATATIIFIQRRQNQNSWGALVGLMMLIAGMFYFNNMYATTTVIISSNKAYLMEGPSSGAKVTAVIAEGNLLQSVGKQDVWHKVLWLDKEGYVKENSLVPVSL